MAASIAAAGGHGGSGRALRETFVDAGLAPDFGRQLPAGGQRARREDHQPRHDADAAEDCLDALGRST